MKGAQLGAHHFHGTPVWGSAGDVHRIAVSGAGAFVSYVRPDQILASLNLPPQWVLITEHFSMDAGRLLTGADSGGYLAITTILKWLFS